jgi:hypothetical protein
MAFFSAWTGGYLYYSSIINSAFEEANRQAAFHTETIKSHLSFFLHENLNSVRALAGLKELPNALSKKDEDSLAKTILKIPTRRMSVIWLTVMEIP